MNANKKLKTYMMSKHTPEPWTIECENSGGGTNISGDMIPCIAHTHEVARVNSGAAHRALTSEEALANARRIVACVNACAGISTEALEAGTVDDIIKFLEHIHGGSYGEKACDYCSKMEWAAPHEVNCIGEKAGGLLAKLEVKE